MDTIVQTAAHESGWVAALLVLMVLSTVACFGYIVRQNVVDLRDLQKFVRSELSDVIDDNTVCLARLGAALHRTKCLADSDIDRIVKPKSEETPELDGTAKRAMQRRNERVQKRQDPKS